MREDGDLSFGQDFNKLRILQIDGVSILVAASRNRPRVRMVTAAGHVRLASSMSQQAINYSAQRQAYRV